MIRENRRLVTNEPVEFEKQPVKVQDYRKITNHLRGIYGIYPNLVKENRRMSTCNQLDSQTLGSQPVMPKNLPRSLFQGLGLFVFYHRLGHLRTSIWLVALHQGV